MNNAFKDFAHRQAEAKDAELFADQLTEATKAFLAAWDDWYEDYYDGQHLSLPLLQGLNALRTLTRDK